MACLLLWVVAGEGYEATEGQGQREENLSGGVQPHLGLHQDLPLRMGEKQRMCVRGLECCAWAGLNSLWIKL